MNKVNIEKDKLYTLYISQNKSMREIAESLNVSVGSIYKYIKKYNIETREPHKGFRGKHHTRETKEKISKAHKGKIVTQETRNKMSESKRLNKEGHKKQRSDGYISVYYPTHPKATKGGYIFEHHLVMENHIGRFLNDNEVVHHINHIRNDNRIENLRLMTFKDHAALHMKERWKKKKGE